MSGIAKLLKELMEFPPRAGQNNGALDDGPSPRKSRSGEQSERQLRDI